MLKLISNSNFSISYHRSKDRCYLSWTSTKYQTSQKQGTDINLWFSTQRLISSKLWKIFKEIRLFQMDSSTIVLHVAQTYFQKGLQSSRWEITFQLILTPDTFMRTDGLNHRWKKYIQWKSMSFAGYDHN